jgi:hypothetical protein
MSVSVIYSRSMIVVRQINNEDGTGGVLALGERVEMIERGDLRKRGFQKFRRI